MPTLQELEQSKINIESELGNLQNSVDNAQKLLNANQDEQSFRDNLNAANEDLSKKQIEYQMIQQALNVYNKAYNDALGSYNGNQDVANTAGSAASNAILNNASESTAYSDAEQAASSRAQELGINNNNGPTPTDDTQQPADDTPPTLTPTLTPPPTLTPTPGIFTPTGTPSGTLANFLNSNTPNVSVKPGLANDPPNGINYANFEVYFNLSPIDFGLASDANDITTTWNKIKAFQGISKNTLITSPGNANVLVAPIDIPQNESGWATLFVYILMSYFQVSVTRAYNITIETIASTTTVSSEVDVDNATLFSTQPGTGIGFLRIKFKIDNNSFITDGTNIGCVNDHLNATIIGNWIIKWLTTFSITDNKKVTVSLPTDSELNKETYIPSMYNQALSSTRQPSVMLTGPLPIPNLTNYEQFITDIPNIFKKYHSKKLKEHLDNSTVYGGPYYETAKEHVLPLSIAPSCFTNSSTSMNYSAFTTQSNRLDFVTVSFNLNPSDFQKQSTDNLFSIWKQMTSYMANTAFTLSGRTHKFPANSSFGNTETGFIKQLLSIYAVILQVSNSRFEVTSVIPMKTDGVAFTTTEISTLTATSVINSFKITFKISNPSSISNPQKNDFLDASTIGQWLINYITQYQPGQTSLPPFIPVPVLAINNASFVSLSDPPVKGAAITLGAGFMDIGVPIIPLYQTLMIDPNANNLLPSTFIGGVNISPNIIKLSNSIRNIKMTIDNNNIEGFTSSKKLSNSSRNIKMTIGNNNIEGFTSSKKLLEHATNGTVGGDVPTDNTTPSTDNTTPKPNNSSSTSSYSILDYIFQFSYITCFVAAILLSISQLIGWDIIAFTFNDTFATYMHVYVGICSIVALFSWFNTNIWYISPNIINPRNVALNNQRVYLLN